ncbi:S8 family peptidase [Psychromicrobium sp. YIM B11713]|uniref:S8 family peptidase n=1 Tax=Psychromicrobium sp. YIM B11713 TaxID=3145233 RepID=UPI00374F4730
MVRIARRHGLAAIALAVPGLTLLSLLSPVTAIADGMRNGEYWLEEYGIAKAWESTKGAGVKVAIIDSGVDGSHPDLQGAVVGGTDVSGAGDADGQKGIGEEPVHGTLVASLLAGRGHGGKPADSPKPDGVVGVAPEAQLLTISTWLGSANPSGKSIDEQIPEAVRWAVDQGAKVINMSLSSTSPAWPASWDSAFLYAEAHDVVIVAAVGNRESGMTQVGAPATIPGVVAVAGLKKDGTSSQTSSTQGITIAVSAPAEALVGAVPGAGYANWSGSSGAAPLVAGVAALIRSKYPEMKAAQVINRILRSAKPAGSPIPNSTYGWGVLDADAAVNADVAPVTVSPLPSLQDWITVHRRNQPSSTPAKPSPIPSSSAGPTLPEPTTPVALPPSQLDSALPATIVIGFGVLLVLVLLGGTLHLLVLRRRSVTERRSQNTS